MRQAILLLGILYVGNERYTRYSVYLLLKGPRRHFAAADGERGTREAKGAERGQKQGKQEPYRGDSHPGTPQGLYRADNPHGTPDGGGPIFLSWKRTENSIGIRKGEGDVNPSPYWRMPIRRMADICIYIQPAAAKDIIHNMY